MPAFRDPAHIVVASVVYVEVSVAVCVAAAVSEAE